MTKEKEIKTMQEAIAYVQQRAPIILKETDNPYFKSKYADLPTIWQAIKSLISEAGLVVYHTTDFDENGNEFVVTTLAGHADKLTSRTLVMLSNRKAQEYGSFLTYIRRYHLSSMLGLQVDNDDDGNAASEPSPAQKQKPAPAKAPEKKAEATPQQKELLEKAVKHFKSCTASEDVTIWFKDNAKNLNILTKEQETWLNAQAAARKNKLESADA